MVLLIIMKVYCPSYKRPDAPLFKIAKNLIIVLNKSDDEEVAEYRRINEPRGHTVIHPDPEQKTYIGLCGTRNWILENAEEDWHIQIDDDVYEFCKYDTESGSYIETDFDNFISETEKVIKEVDNSKTGMIGYKNISLLRNDLYYPIDNKNYEICSRFDLYFCVILNNKLLKSKGFKYNGYPNPKDNTRKHGHDDFIQYWCENEKLDRYKIYSVTIKCKWVNNISNSIFLNLKTEKELYSFRKNVNLWLLENFKDNDILRLLSLNNINYFERRINQELKVYVPSHKRSNSKLFEIADNLNIVLQHEEDIEPYSKWKDKHNVIYIPELRGLLDARNWILDQNDDWFLMLDDDVLDFKKGNDSITWNDFLSYTKDVITNLNKDEVGIVGYNRVWDNYKFTLEYEKSYFASLVIVLNGKLLKSKGFKYEGYPFDGQNGQRAFSEDSNCVYFCHSNNIEIIKINPVSILYNSDHNSNVWEDNKHREKMVFITHLWLLDKYRNHSGFEEFSYLIMNTIKGTLSDLKYYTFEELVNEISYEILDNNKGEESMKKMLVSGLVLFLVFFGISFTSCDTDDKKTDEKVIAEEFRGIWIREKTNINNGKLYRISQGSLYCAIRVTENEIHFIAFDSIDKNQKTTGEVSANDTGKRDVSNCWSDEHTHTIYSGDKQIGTYFGNEDTLNLYGVDYSSWESERGLIFIRFKSDLLP